MKNFWVYSFSLSFNSDLLHVKKKKKAECKLIRTDFFIFSYSFSETDMKEKAPTSLIYMT